MSVRQVFQYWGSKELLAFSFFPPLALTTCTGDLENFRFFSPRLAFTSCNGYFDYFQFFPRWHSCPETGTLKFSIHWHSHMETGTLHFSIHWHSQTETGTLNFSIHWHSALKDGNRHLVAIPRFRKNEKNGSFDAYRGRNCNKKTINE